MSQDLRGQGQRPKDEVEDYSLGSAKAAAGATSVSSISDLQPIPAALYHRRASILASADVAQLLNSFARGQKLVTYDTAAAVKGEGGMRHKLNAAIYEFMVARAFADTSSTREEALRISTSETPFVEPPMTGDDTLNAFVAERTARDDEGGGSETAVKGKEEGDEEASSWQNSSAWRRALLVLLLTLFVVALFHVVASIYLLLSPEIFDHPYACKTKNCMYLSGWVREGLDNKTNPCDNFYKFVCGNYKRNAHVNRGGYMRLTGAIPFEYISNEVLGEMLHRVPDWPMNQILPFYQSCINEHERERVGYDPFVNLLQELKIFHPISTERMDITRTIIRLYRKINKRMFIDVITSEANFIVINIAPPAKEYSTATPTQYIDVMKKTFALLKTDLDIEDDSEIDTIVYVLIRFEAELAYIQSKRSLEIFGFPDKMDTFTNITEFHPNYIPSNTGYFRFDSFVAAMFAHQRSGQNTTIFFNWLLSILKHDDRIHMLFLEDFLNGTPYYVLVRYMQWNLLKYFRVDLTYALYDTMIPIFRDMGYTADERCFRTLFAKLHALSAVRFAKGFKNIVKLGERIDHLLGNITETFLRRTNDFKLKTSIQEHIMETFNSIKYVHPVDVEPYMKIYYKGLNMSVHKYFDNMIQVASIKAENDLLRYQNIPPFHIWPFGKYSVDEIMLTPGKLDGKDVRYPYFPLGAVQQPYMGNDIPIFDLAGLGFYVFAFYQIHYIVEDFITALPIEREEEEPDTTVSIQKRLEMEMLPRLECALDDFRRTIKHMKLEEKGEPKPWGLAKNIAFVYGIQLVVDTLKMYPNLMRSESKNQILVGLEDYTHEQIFFMAITRHTCKALTPERKAGMGQVGSLWAPYLVNTAFRNSEHFSKVWSCGSRRFMNPKKKCYFFPKVEIKEVIQNQTKMEPRRPDPPPITPTNVTMNTTKKP